MTDHCFISYSHADGLEFVIKLVTELEGGYPPISVWFEKRDMHSDKDDWDDQIANAIQKCKCLNYVMSQDSTAGHSNCKDEWTWALKYKKPVVCLWIDAKAADQFRLNSRQKIDFTGDFGAGLGKLRKAIAHLDSPEGQLEELNHRLNDANRDLRRASEADKPRIQADIDDLKKQIEVQQRIVDDPEGAKREAEQKIQNGLERERQPEKPTSKATSTKFINPPPGVAPNYFQDRVLETTQVVDFLNDNSQRLMTIVGRGGVGKTAMVCRLLKGIENGQLPDNLGEMKADGIVYLSEAGSHRVNFANVFYDLCKLLPGEAAQELDAVYKNPQGSTESKMRALLDKFPDGRIILLFDNIEPLINVETFSLGDSELHESLCAFLHGAYSAVKIIVTTRIAPRGLNQCEPGRQRIYHLEEGLPSPYAEKMLRDLDTDGTLGLKDAPEELLTRVRVKTRGFPKALEALKQILASDRYTKLEEILAKAENYLPTEIVEALVGEAFNRLDTNAQKVMQALAVYNRPVNPAAVDYLLAPHIPAMDSAPILQRLANMHFARKESGRFYLHPVDREFAFGLIPTEDLTAKSAKNAKEEQKESLRSLRASRFNAFTQHDLTTRAADYFAQARKPRAEWKKLEDLSAQLAEFDLRCAAGDYDAAASVLLEIDFDYLLLWGHYRLIIELHEKLYGTTNDKILTRASTGRLGIAYYSIGRIHIAVNYFEKVLELARQDNDKQHEGSSLGNLGNTYAILGDVSKAIEYYEQSLVIAREIGDQKSEGQRLGNLGNVYSALGDASKAVEYYEQSLVIARKIGDRVTEEACLGNLGVIYKNLGSLRKAIEYYEQAMKAANEIGNRIGEEYNLGNLGNIYSILDDTPKAIECYEQALGIAREIGDQSGEEINLINLSELFSLNNQFSKAIDSAKQSLTIAIEMGIPATYEHGNLSNAYLLNGQLDEALTHAKEAQKFDEPKNNYNVSMLLGIIAVRQGDEVAARGAFVRAIGQADEILSKTAEFYEALDAKGLALCGLAIIGATRRVARTDDGRGAVSAPDGDGENTGRGDPAPTVNDAIETFRKARKIAPHAGVVKSVLRLFDELVKCDGEGVLKGVREVIEAKPLDN